MSSFGDQSRFTRKDVSPQVSSPCALSANEKGTPPSNSGVAHAELGVPKAHVGAITPAPKVGTAAPVRMFANASGVMPKSVQSAPNVPSQVASSAPSRKPASK